jgi:signal peptidase I
MNCDKGVFFTFKNPVVKEVMDWVLHIAISVIIGVLIVLYVGQITFVKGNSMLPTLQNGNILIVEKISPRFGKLHTGDIVTLYVPEFLEPGKETIIKRIIGTEGDLVEIKNGKVFVNNSQIHEDYTNGDVTEASSNGYSKIIVPKGDIYVLGDNRLPGESKDSRIIGPVSKSKISGRAILRLFPLNLFGTIRK